LNAAQYASPASRVGKNGTLKTLRDEVNVDELSFRPVGDTDSELAFCVLMKRLRGY